MKLNNNLENEVELAAIKALAMTSKSPFKTAFKATLGIYLAQSLITAFGIMLLVICYYIFK
jgi:hypothetical protein